MKPTSFTVRRAAARDLSEEAEWLSERAGPDVAERYLKAAWSSFAAIAEQPGLGAPAEAKSPRLAGARRWKVRGFPDQLIFYAARKQGGVTILRVLGAAQDWKAP